MPIRESTRLGRAVAADAASRKALLAIHDRLHPMIKNADFPSPATAVIRTAVAPLIQLRSRCLQSSNRMLFLKTAAIVAELLDQVGQTKLALPLFEDGQRVLDSVPDRVDTTAKDPFRQLVREEIRYSADFAVAQKYRSYQYADAAQIIERCRRLVQVGGLRNDRFKCHGTLAQCHLMFGHTQAQLGNFDQAARSFTAAIEEYNQRVEDKVRSIRRDVKDPGKRDRQLREQRNYSRNRIAVCLISLGRTEYARGLLSRSLEYAYAAKALLFESNDLCRASVDFLCGRVQRTLAMTSPTDLSRSVDSLDSARKVFKEYGHRPGQAICAYELAVAHARQGDENIAARMLSEAGELADGDPVIQCKVLTRKSRIARERGDFSGALTHASAAANRMGIPKLCLIDALITRAQALMADRSRTEAARAELREAMSLIASYRRGETVRTVDPHHEATCCLLLARTYLADGDLLLASGEIHNAEPLLALMEHPGVLHLARKVRAEQERLRARGAFSLDLDRHGLQYGAHESALRTYLVQKATTQATTEVEAAELLSVSRRTLRDWKRRYLSPTSSS